MAAAFPLRGQIWWADVGLGEPKRFIVVSNNARNRHLRDVLGVRMTTASKPDVPSIVDFRTGEVDRSRSFAVADDIWPLPKDGLVERIGALSRGQMERVDDALRAALDL
jgi:mRNA interferase MazF